MSKLQKILTALACIGCWSCDGGGGGTDSGAAANATTDSTTTDSTTTTSSTTTATTTNPQTGPAAGNPAGNYAVPAEARAEDVSSPDRVVGTGAPASCTPAAFLQAVAQGGRSPSTAVRSRSRLP